MYRAANRHQEAAAIHAELASFLAFADEDHPLRAGLRQDAALYPASIAH